jgi:hypothetical protein
VTMVNDRDDDRTIMTMMTMMTDRCRWTVGTHRHS